MAGIGKLSIGLTALIFHALSSTSAQAENAPPAPVASPEVYKVVAENMDWSVIKATLQPGQEDKFHSHPADQVSLYQTDCKLRLTSLDGTSIVVSQKQGEAAVRMAKPIVAHKVKNIGEKVCIIWIVEFEKLAWNRFDPPNSGSHGSTQSRRYPVVFNVGCGSWPCKNGLKGMSVLPARTGSVSGRDRIDQRLDPDDVYDPCQIIGQNRESHLGGYFWKCFGEKV